MNMLNKLKKHLENKRISSNIFYSIIINMKDFLGYYKNKNNINKIPMIISISNFNCYYVQIPKTGCTSIKQYIKKITDNKIISSQWEFHKAKYNNVKFKDIDKNAFVFTFVRNPYDRILSCYSNKINSKKKDVIKNEYKKGINLQFHKFNKINKKVFYKGISFKDFLKSISKIPDWKADDHFRSQIEIMNYKGKINFNFIGKFENFQTDWIKLLKISNLPKNKLGHKNKSKRKKDWREYYTPELKKLVYKRYKKDFEMFGYDPEKDWE
jgi:chondroitin 4-sulfotransferase 11